MNMASRPKSPRYKTPHEKEEELGIKVVSPRYKLDSPRDKVLVKRIKELFDDLIKSKQLRDIKKNDVDDINSDSFEYLQTILNTCKPANDWEKGSYSMFTNFTLNDEDEKAKILGDQERQHLVLWMDFIIILDFLELKDKVYIRKNNSEKFNYTVTPRKTETSQLSLQFLMKKMASMQAEMEEMKKKDTDSNFDISRLNLDYLSQESESDD